MNDAIDLADVHRRFADNQLAALRFFSLQRAEEWHALDACVLSRHHCLLLGPHGEAKSLLARTWATAFDGAVYRERLCTRQSTEQDLFYYLDVPAFTQGRSVVKIDGKLTEGHIQFWDECFKLNAGTLNAGLGLLNERVVAEVHRSPLITAVGASNEMGEDESVAALEDRWLARFWVDGLDDDNFEQFLLGRVRGDKPPALAKITLAELEAAQAAVRALPVERDVVRALRDLRASLGGVGIKISTRRGGWCVEYLRAIAWLDGAPSVMLDHLDALRHVLWRRPEDRPAVDAAIAQINRGIVSEIRSVCERVLNAYHADRARLNDEDFAAKALEHTQALMSAADEIKRRLGEDVSDYVKERTRAYLGELKEAFQDAKGAHQSWARNRLGA